MSQSLQWFVWLAGLAVVLVLCIGMKIDLKKNQLSHPVGNWILAVQLVLWIIGLLVTVAPMVAKWHLLWYFPSIYVFGPRIAQRSWGCLFPFSIVHLLATVLMSLMIRSPDLRKGG